MAVPWRRLSVGPGCCSRALAVLVLLLDRASAFGGLVHEVPTSLGLYGSSSPWPEDGAAKRVCGSSWQDAYAALHAKLVAEPSPRLLVFDAFANGGLADRLTGLMTVLVLAILTDRALAIDWPSFDAALRTPRIDTAAALKLAQAGSTLTNETRQIRWINSNRLNLREQVDTDLDELWSERVVVIQSNRGFTQGLLTSAQHAASAAARHLSPTNAQYGCLVNFLLRPTEGTLARLQPLHDALVSAHASEAVTIGVHVRTGDASFTPQINTGAAARSARELYATHAFIFEHAVELAKKMLEARMRLRAERRALSRGDGRELAALTLDDKELASEVARRARYVILGDSPALRQYAAKHLGEHSALYWGNISGSEMVSVGHVARQPKDVVALQAAVAEHWLYAGCDAFVFSSHSGYPRTAAARALRDDTIHTCFHYSGPLFNSPGQQRSTARECTGPWTVAQIGDRHAAGL